RIESGMVSRGIERAQKKVEARNYDIRKNLLEYDEVMDRQRRFIYSQRQEVLEMDGMRDKILGMFEELAEPIVEQHAGDKDEPVAWDEIRAWVTRKCGDAIDLDGLEQLERDRILDWLLERFEQAFDRHGERYGEEDWLKVQQFLLLDAIDQK